jgi:hypothetical protein
MNTIEVADRFAAGIRSVVAQGKPVAITEFGSCTYKGAADRGARGGEIVEWDHDTARPLRLNGDYIRDEDAQAIYVRELLAIFAEQGVDSAFVFTFVQYALPHRADGGEGLDKAAYAFVKVYEDRCGETYPDMAWEPKAAFATVADFYQVFRWRGFGGRRPPRNLFFVIVLAAKPPKQSRKITLDRRSRSSQSLPGTLRARQALRHRRA